MKRLLALMFLACVLPVQAAEPKKAEPEIEVPATFDIWKCGERFSDSDETLVLARIITPSIWDLFKSVKESDKPIPKEINFGFGEIEVAGTTFRTSYTVEGFDRRWDWGDSKNKKAARFAFVISPNGTGSYYDFNFADQNGRATSKATYQCTHGTEKNPNKEKWEKELQEMLKDK